MQKQPGAPSSSTTPRSAAGKSKWRRLLLLLVGVIFLILVMREVLFPYRGQPYEEVPHGDHTHYVPKDRDPSVSIGSFPTRPPGPDERITPQGQIVPR